MGRPGGFVTSKHASSWIETNHSFFVPRRRERDLEHVRLARLDGAALRLARDGSRPRRRRTVRTFDGGEQGLLRGVARPQGWIRMTQARCLIGLIVLSLF